MLGAASAERPLDGEASGSVIQRLFTIVRRNRPVRFDVNHDGAHHLFSLDRQTTGVEATEQGLALARLGLRKILRAFLWPGSWTARIAKMIQL